jgi:hypothetical protein
MPRAARHDQPAGRGGGVGGRDEYRDTWWAGAVLAAMVSMALAATSLLVVARG